MKKLFLISPVIILIFTVLALEVDREWKTIPQKAWVEGTKPVPKRMTKHTGGKITSIVIHHTQTPNQPPSREKARLRNIQSYHVDELGWGDIAYHYLIGPSGHVYEGRDPAFRGDSGTKYDLDGRLLICLIGDFGKVMPTKKALNTLVGIVAEKVKAHDLKASKVTSHRAVARTDCPGATLQKWLDDTGFAKIAKAAGGALPD